MNRELTAPSAIASRILEAAGRRGIDQDALRREAGLDRRDAPADGVPLATLFRLWELALRDTEPGFPIDVAELPRLETYGLLTLIGMTCLDLETAFTQMIRFYPLWTNSSRWQLCIGEGSARVVFIQPGELGSGQQCDHEFSLAEMTNAIRALCARPEWRPSEVRFRHAAPSSLAKHEAFFKAHLAFEAARTELVIAPSDLRMPMMRANEMLAAFLQQHCERVLRDVVDVSDVLGQIRAAIVADLSVGVPRLSMIATKLRVGARTLRRHLAAEGTSFKILLDEAREQLARQYLEDRDVPIGEIIYTLGFSEPSAFYRAFKRWTGDSPARYRARSASSSCSSRNT